MGEMDTLYEIVRAQRDRTWDAQGGWEPPGADDGPKGDVQRFWYLQGKAEAFAAVMSEIESAGWRRA